MAEGTGSNIGKAYIQILPSADGIKGKLEAIFGGEGESAGSTFCQKFTGVLGNIGKIGAASLGAASASISAFAKTAFDNYADYEQLVGGVETLFKDSAGTVQQYAENAFKTAGLSANEYMETVTSFAASLNQSLGGDTAKSADMANLAITDMADNANKMGSSIESIQNAYQGFAKGQFNMLDNLKLGYGGTQQEMFRLLQEAAGLNAEFANTANFSMDNKGHLEAGYADIVRAIHIVQTEMGITGTTSKEASETISGSLAALKSSWANLLTGIGDENADFSGLVDNLVDSAMTAGKNVLPRVEQMIDGAGRIVERLAPAVTSVLPGVIQRVVPGLLQSATTLVGTFAETVWNCLPAIGQVGLDLFQTLTGTLSEQLPELIPVAMEAVLNFVDGLITNSDQLIDGALALMGALVEGVVRAIPILVEKAPVLIAHFVEALARNLPKIVESGGSMLYSLLEGIDSGMWMLFNMGADAVKEWLNGVKAWGSSIFESGKDLLDLFIQGIKVRMPNLRGALNSVGQSIRDRIGFSEPKEGPLSNFHTYAPDMMELYAGGITGNAWRVRRAVEQSMDLAGTFREHGALQLPTTQGRRVQVSTPEPRFVDGGSGVGRSLPESVTVVLQLDKTELGRVVVPLVDEERRRLGVRLAT